MFRDYGRGVKLALLLSSNGSKQYLICTDEYLSKINLDRNASFILLGKHLTFITFITTPTSSTTSVTQTSHVVTRIFVETMPNTLLRTIYTVPATSTLCL